ncbi:YciI family protein [Microbacterium sp. BWT-B31]|uniref:YciI family protein n=1 Tax=Microbacterium sp. BWT-B31 TaxID=3232072 RepID=UPI0035291900
MRQWLYRIEPTRPAMVAEPTEDEQRIVGEHFAYLVGLRDAGVLILAGRTQEDFTSFGITIFEAEDEASARSIAEADPAVAAGVFAMTLHPYAVAVSRDGLGG